ncbi:ArgE/DapE family deacylase [Salipiger bermudensis]|uniref:ArgE/DapE family deacylase n=1 Tax=Salipiger bermudensis TaxID=344736 RepID=UPI001C991C95|nr:ArgE/DapE family deacylase [Salipiger bermudensis]MBY6005229.1 ArgE/DapE family deacylase [Salipiger bermudensis]
MALDDTLREDLMRSVTEAFSEQTAYLKTLVGFRSQRGEEFAIQDFIHEDFAGRGLKMDRFEMDEAALTAHEGGAPFSDAHSRAPIVVGIHHPRVQTGRSLILQHHLDVVPVGPREMWTRDPYAGEIEDGWMYGRGAGDMKAGASANVFALEALRRVGLQPAAPVYLQSVVEEESTGNGALQTFLRGYTADAALIPEPEGERLARANVGVLWFEVLVRGHPTHVSEMGSGNNAIDSAYRLIAALREVEQRWNDARDDHPEFAGMEHPINLNIGRIEGGDWGSSVPAWCRFQVRVSIYPGETAQDKLAEIVDHARRFADADPFLSRNPPAFTQNGFNAEGYVLAPGSDAEATLASAHRGAFGSELQGTVTPAYLDARVYALYNKIPTLCYGPTARNIHGFDEAVSLESLRVTTQSMALFIAEWCGVEPI